MSIVPKVLIFKTPDLYTVYLCSENSLIKSLFWSLSFISVCILYQFAILLDVCILLSPQEEDVHSSSCWNRCKHLAAHSSKILDLLSIIILACLGNTQKNKKNKKINKPGLGEVSQRPENNMLMSDKVFSKKLKKILQPFTSVDTASSYKSFPTINKRF